MDRPRNDETIEAWGFATPTRWARRLRRDQTDAERRLWQRLRGHQLGVQFRRQHPLAGFILDFCCVSRLLVVELDGSQHGEPEAARCDAARDAVLSRLGFRVVRFANRQVLLETDRVVEAIRQLVTPPPCPPPPGEGSRSPTPPGTTYARE